MKKIDLLIGHNQYSTAAHFSKSFAAALKRQKIQTRLFYFAPDTFYKAFYPMLSDPPDMTFSFSDIRQNSQSLADLWNIPHFSYLLDPAIYYAHHFQSENCFVSCIDRKDLKVMGNQRSVFLPHAVDGRLFKKPKMDSLYDVVMMGTCVDIEEILSRWNKTYSKRIVKQLHEVAEKVLNTETMSCLEALVEVGFVENLAHYHNEVDLFVGAKERVDLLRSLKGISLHIFGKGPWKKYFPEAVLHPPVTFTRALKVFQQSKIVLNTSSRFKEGAHERIFYAFALHALPFSQQNGFLRQYFDEKSLLTYVCGNYNELKERLEYYLSHEKERQEIVDRGREVTLKNHTWDIRAKVISELVHTLSQNAGTDLARSHHNFLSM